MSKKIPISFNDQELEEINDLAKLFGYDDKIYGGYARVVKLSISLAKKYLEMLQKQIPHLKDEQMAMLLSSIKQAKK